MATTVADLQIIIDGDASGANRAFDQANKDIDKTTKNANKMVAASGLLGFGAVVAGGFGLAINTAMNFDAQLSAIAAVGGPAAVAAIDDIRATALQLGADTSFSASEAAAGMQELIKAGVPVADVLSGGADAMLDLAAATGTAVPQAASVMSASMTILGEDGEAAANRISAAANASRLDVGQWGDAIQQAGPVAKALGVSADDLTTSIVLLSNAGFSGAEAGTAMRNVISNLVNPTKKGRKELDKYGVVTKDAEGNFVGLESIISQMGPKWKEMDAGQKAAFATALVGKENMAGLITLLDGGIDTWNQSEQALASQASAQEQANIMTDNLKGSMDALMGSIETVSIVVGSMLAPYVKALAENVQELVNKFLALSPETQKYIAIGIAAVAGLVALAGALALASTAAGVLAAGFGLLLSPVILIVGAIALLAAGLYYAYTTNFLGFADAIDWVVGKLQVFWDKLTEVWGVLTSIDWSGMWGDVKSVATETWNSISSTVQTTWNTITSAITTAVNTVQSILNTAWSTIQTTASTAWGFIQLAITNPIEAARTAINTAIEAIKLILSTAWTVIQTSASLAWQGIKAAVQLGIDGIRLYIETYINIIKFIITNAWNTISTVTSTVWGALPSIISTALTAIQTTVSNAWNSIISYLQGVGPRVLEALAGFATLLLQKGIDLFVGLFQGLITYWPSIKTWLGTVGTLALAAIGNLAETLLVRGIQLFSGFWRGILNMWDGSVKPWLNSIGDMAIKAVGGLAETLMERGNQLLKGLKNGAENTWDTVVEWLGTLGSVAKDKVGDLSGWLYEAGKSLLQGLLNGLDAMLGPLDEKIGQILGLINKIPIGWAIDSPSKLTMYYGEMLGSGLVKGIDSMIPKVAAAMGGLSSTGTATFSTSGSPMAAPVGMSRTTNVYLTQHNTIDASNVEELMSVTTFLNDLESERVNTFGHNF